MRRLFAFVVTAMVASAGSAATINQPAPDFSALDAVSGKTITLASLKGKTVVLEWNNFDCPFVKKFYNVGAMQKLQAEAAKDGIVWISINSSAAGKEGHLADSAAAKAALAQRNASPAHYFLDHDGAIGKAYGAKSTPHMYVIDKTGTLVYAGAIDSKASVDSADISSATNYVTAALADLKAGRPVKTTATQAYGCFVKY